MQAGQPALDRCQITHAWHIEAKCNHDRGDNSDTGQRRRDHFGDPRHDPDNRHRHGNQRQHQHQRLARQPFTATHAVTSVFHGTRHFELPQLSQENHDRQTVHKPQHHRMRHQTDKLAPLHDPRKNLQKPHQHNGGKQVFNPMLGHERHHHDGKRPCRARNHPRPPTDQGCDQPDQKRRVKPYQRVHTGHKSKRNRLGDESQGHGQPRQKLNAQARRCQPVFRRPAQIRYIQISGKLTKGRLRHEWLLCCQVLRDCRASGTGLGAP